MRRWEASKRRSFRSSGAGRDSAGVQDPGEAVAAGVGEDCGESGPEDQSSEPGMVDGA